MQLSVFDLGRQVSQRVVDTVRLHRSSVRVARLSPLLEAD